MASSYVGSSVGKISDSPILTGRATYTGDITLPGTLYGYFVRATYAHARILNIDTSKAAKMPGVEVVLTGEDAKEYPIQLHMNIEPYKRYGAKEVNCYPLTPGKVRFAGEPIALVVASTKHTAAEAARFVEVEYEPLPAVVNPEEALKSGSSKVYDDWDSNLFIRISSQMGDIDKAFKNADYTLSDTVKIQRFTGAPLEPRCYIAEYDKVMQRLIFYVSDQQPHPLRTMVAETFRLPESKIRVIQPCVGGGFGLKTPPFQEEMAVVLAALKLGRPVKWTAERWEDLVAGGHARDQKHYFQVAFDKGGRVLGLKVKMIADVGALQPTPGWGMPIVTTIHIPTVYKIENFFVESDLVVTNKNPLNSYRGYGKECACFLMERVMDLIATKLDIDRTEVRLRNFIQPEDFPYRLSPYTVLDSGNYPSVLRKATEIFGYKEWLEKQAKARAEGKYLGIGMAYELTPGGGCIPGSLFLQYDGVTMKISPSGDVMVFTGITSPGNGQETGIAQIVADHLGVNISDVTVFQGDTDLCPYGLGNMSDRSMITGGPAAMLAAKELKAKMTRVAAEMLEANVADIEASGGYFYVKGSKNIKQVSFKGVATAIYKNPYDLARDVEPGLEVTRYYKMPNAQHAPDKQGYTRIYTSFPNGAHMCAVEVDPETGQVKILRYVMVDDCGRIINPLMVEGQLHGGIAQGLGGTFLEELVYNSDGQLQTVTFMDYPIPTAMEVPDLIIEHQETPSPYNPLGAKGVGESGTVGAPPCIVSAVEDALKPLGVRIMETPIRPGRVWKLIQESKAK